MTDMNIDQVLAQMRTMSIDAGGKSRPVDSGDNFAAMLKQSIDGVNETQQTSSDLAKQFETGDPDVGLAEVMIASQKANVSFQAMVQVRNKLVEAYKDIMNMPM